MRDFARRNQLFTFSVLFLIDFIIIRWLFRLSLPLNIEISREDIELILQITIAFALTVVVWVLLYGYQQVEPNTAVIVKGLGNPIWVYLNRGTKPDEPGPTLPENTSNEKWYLSIPLVQKVLAIMPDYQFTFEFEIKDIDTQTSRLNRINKIRVRATCRITDHRIFFFESPSYFDRIQQMLTEEKRQRSDPLLWRQLLQEIVQQRIDDAVRDVVWRWHEHIARDPSLLMRAAFTLDKPSELDPYDLSVNRGNLAKHVKNELQSITSERGYAIGSLVFEVIEIDPELIKRKNRNKQGEIADAIHEATKEAEAIRAKGFAEAEVRATTLAKLLDILINTHDIPYNDPLIAKIVRAAFYSDGEMIWKGVLEKSASGDGKVKTA